MKQKENEAGYYMLFISEYMSLNKCCTPEDVAAVLYNLSNFAAKQHGYKPPKDLPMTDVGHAMYTMVRDRIKQNLTNASRRKPGGAPKGNTNATIKDSDITNIKIETLHNLGLNDSQIAREVGCSRQTVSRRLKKLQSVQTNIEGVQTNIEDDQTNIHIHTSICTDGQVSGHPMGDDTNAGDPCVDMDTCSCDGEPSQLPDEDDRAVDKDAYDKVMQVVHDTGLTDIFM